MTTYTNPFGGGTTTPSPSSYAELFLGGAPTTFQLLWPGYVNVPDDDEIVIGQINDILAGKLGDVIKLPDSRAVGAGQWLIFANQGANNVTVQDFDAGAVTVIAPGEIRFLYNTSNSTAAGSWFPILFGVGLGSLDIAQAAGYGLLADGLQLQTNRPTTEVSADFSIDATMRASVLVWTGGVGTVTLPLASFEGAPPGGFHFGIRNQGTGTLTLSPTVSAIDGTATIVLQPNESCEVFADGSGDWYTVGRGRNQQFNFTLLVKAIAGGTVTLTPTEASNVVQQYIGVLVSNAEIVLPSVVQVYYVSNQTSGAFTVTFKTAGVGTTVTVPSGQNAILFCDGLNVINNSTTVSGLTALILAAGTVTTPSISYSGDSSTGIYRPVAGSVGIVGLGGEVLRLTGVATGVNFLQITNAIAGQHPVLAAVGADANINITLTPKGTGVVTSGAPFAFALGAVGAPSITFVGDLNTGIWSSGADNISFSTAGALRHDISSVGKHTFYAPSSGATVEISQVSGGTALNIEASLAGVNVDSILQNTSNTASAQARHFVRVGGATAGDPFTHYQIIGVQDWAIGVDNSDSDRFKISRSGTLGTNDSLTIDTNGAVIIRGLSAATAKSLLVTAAVAGAPVDISVANTDNTNVLSDARIILSSGGAAAGDPIFIYDVAGAINWTHGVDNSAGDVFKISLNASLGSGGDVFIIDRSGNLGTTVSGSLVTSPNATAGRGTINIDGSGSALLSMTVGGSSRMYMFHDNLNLSLINTTGAGILTLGANSAGWLNITANGRVYGAALHNNAGAVTGTTDQYIASGTYTPALTNGSNVSSSSSAQCQWMRVGNVVTVSGSISIDLAAANTISVIEIALPIASNAGIVGNIAGTGVNGDNGSSSTTIAAAIYANTASDRAAMRWFSGSSLSLDPWSFHFTYVIL